MAYIHSDVQDRAVVPWFHLDLVCSGSDLAADRYLSGQDGRAADLRI
jgi:hypothetical protein